MHVRHLPTHVEVLAPAKVNLFLEVLARRPDGFHEIETLMVAVAMADTLRLAPRVDGEIRLQCRWAYGLAAGASAGDSAADSLGEIPSESQNLVWRAVEWLRKRAGHSGGADIELIKRVPAAAGLGGASSDAAAALVAANAAWRLGWSRERLAEVAAELGSDVPFFLGGGAAICRGRGEQIEPLRAPRLHIALVRPPVGLSTPQVYSRCLPSAAPVGASALVRQLARGDVAAAGRAMKNDLQPAAEALSEWIGKVLGEIDRAGAAARQMSGSGSSCFGLCHSARHARRVASRLGSRRIGLVTATSTTVAT